ncbi:D-alanyl-D-alanine carboxypeptidase/D-alanyl-D-alanine endopeptidase [Bailinhaonella thermotolerans]|uniref:D-alanyl-D-alanine carboxypeptidase/D-alanyl-D-alanine-endopeptidase n=1 Tax=Bailinhaonella thermotolerans TaxID=1070861 RepID=A0A3A4AVZ1_9ACTN|nr:D-alanyl-D-alanine carboxypeptidase/D-alanyl-D-alanine-endopeptidase [Bailinhaonella thermotolerans]RJL34035.1 D-alanyl-D-alanine carboxypeptidase/D-alanyl-D-alanine-endopeptidase [Bailinhaonella thermotolerans]
MRSLPRVLAALAAAGALLAGPWAPVSGERAGPASLRQDLDRILADPRLATARAGVVVRAAGSGEVLYERDASALMTPASNEKLLTAAAAFAILGPGHRFRTAVLAAGERDGSALRGDLVLKGTGDPTATARAYDELAAKTAASGVRTVRGRLVADDTWFDDVRLGPFWAWDDEPYAYSAPISALTVSPDEDYDAGAVIVTVRPGAAGRPARVTLTPETGAVRIVNRATTGGTGSSITVDRAHGSAAITVSGSIAPGSPEVKRYMSVWDPTAYAADVFRRALARHGVRITGPTVRRAAPAGASELAARESAPLSAVAVPYLKLSNNMIAEILVKSMGRKAEGAGTWAAGLRAMEGYLRGRGLTGLRATDGSGLSRADLVSPAHLARLLEAARSEPWFPAFLAALPVAGDEDRLTGGTLRSRMRGTPAAGNARAKTGTLTSVSSLSGYVRSAGGEDLIFSIMLNHHLTAAPRDVEDAIAVRLARFRRDEPAGGALTPRAPLRTAPGTAHVECAWVKSC